MTYKHNLAIFCKTCVRDIENLKLLLSSIKEFNKDNIPICVSIAKKEKEILEPLFLSYDMNITVFYDEDITRNSYKDQNDAFMRDWVSQQYVKMDFYKTKFAKHYVVMDTDSYFIKDFHISDFLYDENTPYIPIIDHTKGERILQSLLYPANLFEKQWFLNINNYFRQTLKSIAIDNPWVLTSDYMEKFEAFLKNKGDNFYKIFEIEPSEMQWYISWILFADLKFKPTTAFFFWFHIETQYQIFRWLGFDEDIFKRNYLGIIMNKGHVKSIKYKPLWIGQHIIRPIIQWHYEKTKGRNDYEKITTTSMTILQKVFSVTNEYKNNIKHKVVIILGIKIKLKTGSNPVAAERE